MTMRAELKQVSSVGNKEGILYFIKILLKHKMIEIVYAREIILFTSGMQLDFLSCLYLFEYLGIVDIRGKKIFLNSEGLRISELRDDSRIAKVLCELCFQHLFDDDILITSSIHFDESQNQFYVERFGFPLFSAVLRNFLIECKALTQQESKYYVDKEFELFLTEIVIEKTHRISIDQLRLNLEQQSIRGMLSEEFVVKYENKRLMQKPALKVKRISDIDVSAGYDIVSLNDIYSKVYDRFIEVKSFIGDKHFFWSINEIEHAKIKGAEYYIYLVDFSRINEVDYSPEILKNPIELVWQSREWLIEPTGYHFTKID